MNQSKTAPNFSVLAIWHWLVCFLILILPFNNLLIQVLNYCFKIPQAITLYKEIGMLILIVLMLFQIMQSFKSNKKSLIPTTIPTIPIILAISLFIYLFFGIFSTWKANIDIKYWLLGFRVEILWVVMLAIGLVWIRLTKSTNSINLIIISSQKIFNYVRFSYIGVLIIATVSNLVGVERFYKSLGFKDGWESNGLVLESPICHGGGSNWLEGCRLTAGFSTPNNLAGYLLLVLPVLIIFYNQSKTQIQTQTQKFSKVFNLFLIFSNIICIAFTYSRFAWLALALGFLWFLKIRLYKVSQIFNKTFNRIFNWSLLVLPLIFLAVFLQLVSNQGLINSLPPSIGRVGSSNGHYKLTSLSLEVIQTRFNNLVFQGYGVSQTGPIAKPQYQDVLNTNFVRENGYLAKKYQLPEYEISIPENWYLQIWLNGGLVYLIAFLALIAWGLWPLFNWDKNNVDQKQNQRNYQKQLLAISIYMICVGNLFLHIWENPVITFYFVVWIWLINQGKLFILAESVDV